MKVTPTSQGWWGIGEIMSGNALQGPRQMAVIILFIISYILLSALYLVSYNLVSSMQTNESGKGGSENIPILQT